MSWTITRGGAHPCTAAAFGVLTTAAGVWDVHLSDGQARQVVIADAVSSRGVGWAEFSGLTPGADYTLTAADGQRTETVRFRTAATAHLSVIGSCWQTYSWFEPVAAAIRCLRPAQIVNAGDGPYVDNGRQVTTAVGVDAQVAALRLEYFRFLQHSSRRQMLLEAAHMHTDSDHDYAPGNDYPGRDDVGAFPGEKELNYWYYFNSSIYPKAVTATGQAGADYAADLIAQGKQAFRDFTRNPQNPDSGLDFGGGVVPADAVYTRWTIGRVEYFLLTQTWYADHVTQTGVTNRSMLGATQLAWLLNRVRNSTATFKIIIFPQMLLTAEPVAAVGRNNYARACYSDEGATIKAALTDFSGWTVPGGVIVFSGDTHTPTVICRSGGAELWQITPCPSGTDGVPAPTNGNTGAGEYLRFSKSYAGTNPPGRYFGTVEDTGSGNLIVAMRNHAGAIEWLGELPPGANGVVYPAPKAA